MTEAAPIIVDYWRGTFDGREIGGGAGLSLVVSETLVDARPAMILRALDGSTRAVVRPELADWIGVDGVTGLSVELLEKRLTEAGIFLHDPDCLFYLPNAVPPIVPADRANFARRLVDADRAAFDAFHAEASEQDREDSWVEFDHPTLFGCFEGDRLVSAASLYPWAGGRIGDLGVLTLPDARGRNHARAVVEAICRFARSDGLEPQYRCQTDNHASIALAKACGMILFGEWRVAAPMTDGANG